MNEAQAREVCRRAGFARLAPVAGAHHRIERVVHERRAVKPRPRSASHAHTDVGALVGRIGKPLVGDDGKLDPGVYLIERMQARQQPAGREGRRRRDRHRITPPPFPERRDGTVQIVQALKGGAAERFALCGEPQGPGAVARLDQGKTDPGFQFPHMAADRRVGDFERPCRRAHAARIVDGGKGPQAI